MKNMFRSLALAGLFATGAAGVLSISSPVLLAQAQKAKTPATAVVKPEKEKPTDKTTTAAKGSVVISKGNDDKFRVMVKNDEGKTIMFTNKGYATEKEAKEIWDDIKSIIASSKLTMEKDEEKSPSKDK